MNASRIHRLLRLITLLQSGQVKSAQELANELGISRRTLFRDLNMLEMAGIPYYHEAKQGFRIARSFFLPPVSLTLAETLGLMLFCKSAGSRKGWPLRDSAIEAMNKLVATVPHPIRSACSDLTANVSIDNGPQPHGDNEAQYYITLQRCIDEKTACRIGYKSPDETTQMHCRLHPYGLHFANRAWYVMGQTDIFPEVRTFKLARLNLLEPLDIKFDRPRSFKVEEKLGQAWQLIPEGRIYQVELVFSAKVGINVSEVLWHRTQKHTLLEDGKCRMTFEVDGLREIAWWICGYANQVKVIKPIKLRGLVQNMLQSAVDQYEKGYERPIEVKTITIPTEIRSPKKGKKQALAIEK